MTSPKIPDAEPSKCEPDKDYSEPHALVIRRRSCEMCCDSRLDSPAHELKKFLHCARDF